jgi:NAD(P)-dependent dehydrogenase (short-subunit alcohol dehydrogenase family)
MVFSGGFSMLKKHCIITGGTRGIGKAIADRFLAEGAYVTVVSRSAPLTEVTDAPGSELMCYRGDVTKETTWQNIFKRVVSLLLSFCSRAFLHPNISVYRLFEPKQVLAEPRCPRQLRWCDPKEAASEPEG